MDTLEGFHRVSSVEKIDGMGHNVHSRRGSMESVTRAVSSPRLGPGDNVSPNALGAENTGTSFHFINSELFNCNQQQLMMEHEPILSSILEGGDLVVEGFYHEGVTRTASDKKSKPFDTSTEKSTQDRMEVAIFKSDMKRQIIVVYQDCVENQSNPVKKREQKDGIQRRFHIGSGKDDDNRFSEEQPYPVFPPFRKAYFENGDIESQVFETLDKLAEQNPFYDIIMTGHSMGGVLSLLASMRFADAKPALMVSCFAFGCPKIGSLEFRFYINSLPNLKVMRFEYGYDPWTYCPEHPMWVHAGHTIAITKRESKLDAGGPSHHVVRRALSDGVTHASSTSIDLLVKAFKFGAVRPDSSGSTKGAVGGGGIGKILNRHRERNMDHEISSYVHALERIQTFDDNSNNQVFWPLGFVGEDGSGVEGLDHEKRLVC
jgi:pimeloyl-ACP methyl ester carboxylesterase